MAKQRRMFRVAERIQAVLATTILRLSDPRLHLVTVTSVSVSKDLRVANVYWSVIGDESQRDQVAEAFEAASGLFRSSVASELDVRSAPLLRFFFDTTLDIQHKVDELMSRIKTEPSQDDG